MDVRVWFYDDVKGEVLWQDSLDSGIDSATWFIDQMIDGEAGAVVPPATAVGSTLLTMGVA